MPMIDQNKPSRPRSAEGVARIAQDERLAAMVSAYLDGELTGDDLLEFERLLRSDGALAREIAEMKRIDRQLTGLGADILAEPIPEALLDALARFESE